MRRLRAIAWALAACAAVASPCRAHFESAILSARMAALGGAFVSLADDPAAVVDNGAGMTGISSASFLFTWQRPYGVDGLDEGFVAAVVPVPHVTLGAAWFHRSLDDALSEDRVTLSVARDLRRTSEDASLAVGVGVDFYRVAAQGDFDDAANAVGVNASMLLRPFAFIGVGYRMQAINRPEFDLVAGGGATRLQNQQAVGLSYYWEQRLVVTVESRQASDASWRAHAGMELRASDVLKIRAGLDDGRATAGFGVTWQGVTVDAAMRTHDMLGASYLLTLQYRRPQPEVPYGAY
jgi:hypothetical protein